MSHLTLFFSDVPAGPEGSDAKERAEAAIRRHVDADGSPSGAAVRLRWAGKNEWQVVSAKPIERPAVHPRDTIDPREEEAAQRVALALRAEGITVRD